MGCYVSKESRFFRNASSSNIRRFVLNFYDVFAKTYLKSDRFIENSGAKPQTLAQTIDGFLVASAVGLVGVKCLVEASRLPLVRLILLPDFLLAQG